MLLLAPPVNDTGTNFSLNAGFCKTLGPGRVLTGGLSSIFCKCDLLAAPLDAMDDLAMAPLASLTGVCFLLLPLPPVETMSVEEFSN